MTPRSMSARRDYAVGPNSGVLRADPQFDPVITDLDLSDSPARISYRVKVGGLVFMCGITYESIDSWVSISSSRSEGRTYLMEVVAVIVAWDAMRFLALGGTALRLPRQLAVSADVAATWAYCFLRQFGEWRFRNRIEYPSGAPMIHPVRTGRMTRNRASGPTRPEALASHLLANGGGKDTLAGILLLQEAGIPFDLYEGILPLGGKARTQRALLSTLAEAAGCKDDRTFRIRVEDDFFDAPAGAIADAGVKVLHYRADFAVGHTANYLGYLPLILAHGYTRVWFNIERSADSPQVMWGDEPINHQWCKSREYQDIATRVVRGFVRDVPFEGFGSTLRGLYDLSIYRIVSRRPDLLRLSQSCNIRKPWCHECAKCCYCYLMTVASLGEDFAMSMFGLGQSLFGSESCEESWRSILDPSKVAWECVPSHEECLVGVEDCISRGLRHPLLARYRASHDTVTTNRQIYSTVRWEDVPPIIQGATRVLLEQQ